MVKFLEFALVISLFVFARWHVMNDNDIKLCWLFEMQKMLITSLVSDMGQLLYWENFGLQFVKNNQGVVGPFEVPGKFQKLA